MGIFDRVKKIGSTIADEAGEIAKEAKGSAKNKLDSLAEKGELLVDEQKARITSVFDESVVEKMKREYAKDGVCPICGSKHE